MPYGGMLLSKMRSRMGGKVAAQGLSRHGSAGGEQPYREALALFILYVINRTEKDGK